MTQQEVIKTFMESLNNTTLQGEAALDEAIKASSKSKFKSFKELKTQFLADLKAAKNYQTFLVKKCGIILDNDDTGAISGSDAGGSKVKTANDIFSEIGEAQYPEGTSFTVDGLTIYGIPPKEELTADQQYVVQGLYSWWIRDSLALIKESYGFTFTEENTTGARMKLIFDDDKNDKTLASVSPAKEDEKTFESAILCVNMAHFKNMSSDDRHGATIVEGIEVFLDRTLIHELVHGVMASNINYLGDLPMFLIEGGSAELIHGVDDERRDEIIGYIQKPDILEEILTTYLSYNNLPDDDDDDSDDDDDATYPIYAGGYTFMRYFAKQAGTDTTFDYDAYNKNLSAKDGFAVNYHDTVTITGGKSNDTITNSGSDVLIKTGSGKDSIKSYSDKVTISAGNGADYISNEGEKVSISAGAGNDSILNQANNATIAGGNGNDSIVNKAENVSIDGGTGKDSINNISEKVTINGDAGNDSIDNLGSNVMISDGDGNDYVYNLGLNVTISGGDGNDSISNYGSNASISGDSGNDTIGNFSKNVTVRGGADNNYIQNKGSDSKIYGDAGNDFILNGIEETSSSMGLGNSFTFDSASKITLSGGDGDDTIKNIFEKVKIYGGNDNDSIYNEGKEVSIYGGNDNDSIFNKGKEVSIYGGAGIDFVENHGKSVAVSLGTGNDSLKNYSDSISVDGGAGKDTFINFGLDISIVGGTGDDSIYDYGLVNTLLGGTGNDYIYSGGVSSTINGEDGDDFILNEGMKSYILGGADNDTIRNEGDRVTINGGAGNDSIKNDGGKYITYEFGENDGKDNVVGFNANDTIKITSGKYSAKKSGKNVIVKVGDATLTLKNAVGKKINFISASGKKTSKTYSAKLKKETAPMWFIDDDNFATSDNLSSIVKSKEVSANYSELELSSGLTKKNNLATFSGKKK
ncbi:MAG: calcium-binding protein [Selenomonadaceae bacterium]|nr:calcium-binding protein [Selenomonadaceae bacterium]